MASAVVHRQVFLRMSHCKKQCRALSEHVLLAFRVQGEHDDRHFQCMHLCGPKITKCMQQTCWEPRFSPVKRSHSYMTLGA